MHILTVAAEKGGVGKTTVASNLAAALADYGRVLAVDCDPQMNLGMAFRQRADPTHNVGTLLDPDTDGSTLDAIIADVAPGVDLLAAQRASLELADRRLTSEPGGHTFLTQALAEIDDRYDWAVIDTPPSMGILTLNAVAASHYVVGVYQSEPWSMNGVGVFAAFMEKHRKRGLTSARFLGLINNRVNPRLGLTRAINEAVDRADLPVFETRIPQEVAVSEASSIAPVVLSRPRARAAEAFRLLTAEIVAMVGDRSRVRAAR